MAWAINVKKYLPKENNPAEWEQLKWLLEPREKQKRIRHMPALDPNQMPDFMNALHSIAHLKTSAICLEFAILTCVRSSNVRFMRWEQLKDNFNVWEIDADEMKVSNNGQHKIPLSKQAKAIIEHQRKIVFNSPWVFPSKNPQKPLIFSALNKIIKELHANEISEGREGWIDRRQTFQLKSPQIAVQHGISRATFKTWAENTRQDTRATELVLHHEIDHKFKGAYDRGEDMRFKLLILQKWADFCYSRS